MKGLAPSLQDCGATCQLRPLAHRRARQARVLRLLPRDSERRRAHLHHTRQPTWSWRRQLTHRTTATRQGERCPAGAAAFYMAQANETSACGVRAQKARVLRLLPRDSQRSRLRACFTRGSQFDEHDQLARGRRARAAALPVYEEKAKYSRLSRARAVPHWLWSANGL